MNIVVAVKDTNGKWAIGNKGELLVKNDYDLEHFKNITIGKTVVYGRKTLDTFPKKKPLKGRTNLVLSRDKSLVVDGATVIHSDKELARFIKRKASLKTPEKRISPDDIYLIGGASLYNLLYKKCKYAFVTHFESTGKDEEADAFFPNLANDKNWEIVEETPTVTYKGVAMRFVTYRNKKVEA